jgi:hypothetical protein
MDDVERFRLLSKYKTPRFRIGRKVFCEIRGEVTICGINDTPIPWPLCKRGRGSRSLVVYKDLLKALRRESNQAIAHWWGVAVVTVSKWRRFLGIPRTTEGSSRILRQTIDEIGEELRACSKLKARDPERRRKIAEALRGKP